MLEFTLTQQLEAILFVAPEPVTASRLAEVTGEGLAGVEEALADLKDQLARTGIRLSLHDGKYRLVSAPEAATSVKQFLQQESNSELSRAALETLAIIAYRGPVTRSNIEAVRGVASETMIRNLIARGLIAESGKSAEPGRPVLYAVSHGFLEHFGLTHVSELPPIPEPEHEN